MMHGQKDIKLIAIITINAINLVGTTFVLCCYIVIGRSPWPRGLILGSVAVRLLG